MHEWHSDQLVTSFEISVCVDFELLFNVEWEGFPLSNG